MISGLRVKIAIATLLMVSGATDLLLGQSSHLKLKDLLGAAIVAADGQGLGVISANRGDPRSVISEIGRFGKKNEGASLHNPFGLYGSTYSSLSAYATWASHPPRIEKDGELIAYLTKNPNMLPYVDPDLLFKWLYSNSYVRYPENYTPPADSNSPLDTPQQELNLSYPGSGTTQQIDAILESGARLTLLDGSSWEVCPVDQGKILSWETPARVFVTGPDASENSECPYTLINTETRERVTAKYLGQVASSQ